MAELLVELENMAANAAADPADCEVELSSIRQWQRQFGLSHDQARTQIKQYRLDIGRRRLPDELWEATRARKEAEGFDRESYEYSLQQHNSRLLSTTTMQRPGDFLTQYGPSVGPHSSMAVYIFKLDGPISSAEAIQKIAHLDHVPEIVSGIATESGEVVPFCKIDLLTLQKIVKWAGKEYPFYRPTVVRLSMAAKDLSSVTMGPTLGIDTTLPQHRPTDDGFVPLPAPNQYPVWYFFYGNLARPDELRSRLGLTEPPMYVPAQVQGAAMRSWRGKYRALIDSEDSESFPSWVDGSAYLVGSKAHEDVLRLYETEKYEVVRCRIYLRDCSDNVVDGLVFRFAGFEDELV